MAVEDPLLIDPDRVDAALRAMWNGDPSTFDRLMATSTGSGPAGIIQVHDLVAAQRELTTRSSSVTFQIEGFEILREIGRGGMGVVFAARQHHPSRIVALKLLKHEFAGQEMIRRFDREVRLLAKLQHPGIASIYGSGSYHGPFGPQPYYAMELVEGVRITDFSTKHGLSIEQRLELLCGVCEAVQYAHQKGIIHRDLKPDNVLVVDPPNPPLNKGGLGRVGQPKVLDFGVARLTDDDPTSTVQTQPGDMVGTLPYMSPEQVSGADKVVDTRSDVYALGVIGYELLAEKHPLDLTRVSPAQAARLIAESEPKRLRSVNPRISTDLEAIFSKALEKDPQRRYQSPKELAGDIKRYLRDEPVEARSTGPLYRARKFVSRHRLPVGLAAVLFLSFAALAVVSTVQALRVTQQRNRAVDAEQSASRRFDQVRELANTFLFDIHDEIVNLPGSTEARQKLVATALEYLDSLAGEAADDPELLFELAQAYQRVGLVQASPRVSNLGDFQGGLKSHFRAIEILEQLVTDYPEEPRYYEFLGLGEQYVGEMRDDVAGSEWATRFRRAIGIFESLTGKFPAELKYTRRLYQAYLGKSFGLAANQHYEPQDVVSDLDTTRILIEAVLEANPQDFDARQSLAIYHGRMGDFLASPFLHQEFNDPNKALEHYESALAIDQKLVQDSPDNLSLQRSLMVGLGRTAKVLNRIGRSEDALNRMRETVDRAEALVQADPNDARARMDLFAQLQALGDLQAKNSKDEEALASYQRSIEVLEVLIELYPTDAVHRCRLGTLCQQMSTLHEKHGEWSSVIETAHRALAVWESDLVIRFLGPMAHGKVVETTVQRLADVYSATGDSESVLDVRRRAVDIFERMIDGFNDTKGPRAQLQLSLARAFARLGDALTSDSVTGGDSKIEQEDRAVQACEVYQRAAELLASLTSDPYLEGVVELLSEVETKLSKCP